jgi:hypothetical protein
MTMKSVEKVVEKGAQRQNQSNPFKINRYNIKLSFYHDPITTADSLFMEENLITGPTVEHVALFIRSGTKFRF